MKQGTKKSKKKAVVLVSGGLDSTTCLAIAKSQGFKLYALTLSYGQRHQVEIQAARKVAKAYRVQKHLELRVPLTAFGGSALTDGKIRVPKSRSLQQMGKGIPSTYVPARNTVFLSLALAWAEVLGAEHIFIGVNAMDYSGYPDCRPEFIRAFEKLAKLATKKGVEGRWKLKIHTPLIRFSKAKIIKTGLKLGVDYAMTHSCYDPQRNGRPCGKCDSCRLREKGFKEAESQDPISRKN
ncbi:MAG TPA: 7-cyano-7-deazaguanine synthase QueC [bacterium]|nr:7-cyano-7-deazaguanine synthase QueC [bacterium]